MIAKHRLHCRWNFFENLEEKLISTQINKYKVIEEIWEKEGGIVKENETAVYQ